MSLRGWFHRRTNKFGLGGGGGRDRLARKNYLMLLCVSVDVECLIHFTLSFLLNVLVSISNQLLKDFFNPALLQSHRRESNQWYYNDILFDGITQKRCICTSEIGHYIKDLLRYNDSRRTLRSSNKRLLNEPRANLKTYGERAFSVAAPRLWNKLPLQIRFSSSGVVFKANLKTYLFECAFDL